MSDPDPVLSLSDLASWSFPGTALAVLGQPIKHSISPAMHNAALAEMARLNPRLSSWKYFRFEVPPAELPQALSLLHTKKFRGLNLTVPHKVLAVECLADIDPAARTVGAVNTLLWTEAGWHGHNTDGFGLASAVREDLQRDLAGSHILLLGAGGAARSAAVECLLSGCASLTIANRTAQKVDALLLLLRPIAGAIPLRGGTPSSVAAISWPEGVIVINATSAGLRDSDPVPLDPNLLDRASGVYDMIYNPPSTPLLHAARSRGVPSANGLSMLVHQGAKSLGIWTGATVPVPVMRKAALNALS